MLTIRKPKEPSPLETEIMRLLNEMSETEMESEEYAKLTEQFTKLYKLNAETSRKPVSSDTLALIIANLAGIIVIIGHERANVITTKALNFLARLK